MEREDGNGWEDPPASGTTPKRCPLGDSGPYTAGMRLDWPNRFATLGGAFYTTQQADPVPEPHWVSVSARCAESLGWPADWWSSPELDALRVFSGAGLWPGMKPLAGVYSGHQFGVWAGQLGDGRALLLGEVDAPGGGQELQLKGSGLTPYSRMGDGRAVLRSSIREYLCSEAMHALGVPTTRALCLIGSPLPVRRETLETAAVVTRVAPSFLRFGHFEHFAQQDPPDALRALADFTIEHYYPALRDAERPYAALLEAVTRRTARLVAHWQAIGFCHGVMNTDNMSMLGLTIDYGPFGFLDAFDPGHVCNHSDHQGRYAYARQPRVAFWNLHALAQAMMPLIGETEQALAALKAYEAEFPDALLGHLRAKLGLTGREDEDPTLADDLLKLMAESRADFTITFRRLADLDADRDTVRDLFLDREAFDAWAERYAARLARDVGDPRTRRARMNAVNPKFVLRNHLAEQAIRQAREGDFSEVDRLLAILAHPFDEQVEHEAYAGFPPEWASHLEVSCSS